MNPKSNLSTGACGFELKIVAVLLFPARLIGMLDQPLDHLIHIDGL
jgi:hypothetical protein